MTQTRRTVLAGSLSAVASLPLLAGGRAAAQTTGLEDAVVIRTTGGVFEAALTGC